jgi:hypothetical protein
LNLDVPTPFKKLALVVVLRVYMRYKMSSLEICLVWKVLVMISGHDSGGLSSKSSIFLAEIKISSSL